ncbi:unnamed protein product [Vitrella brassicaformis CCMP3155]|uniref:Uncharacterized protein n=2 Tax=Vitrella brassicaformis TaxID=1169539 RepID=A0A0G4EX83_VITBC|nr:unnamed protein product [Vitrella brassicaformis CCMP3155]|eukprot:CEM03612.1 unnamed protein product [Vitrella brassicaformis CCMP3155]
MSHSSHDQALADPGAVCGRMASLSGMGVTAPTPPRRGNKHPIGASSVDPQPANPHPLPPKRAASYTNGIACAAPTVHKVASDPCVVREGIVGGAGCSGRCNTISTTSDVHNEVAPPAPAGSRSFDRDEERTGPVHVAKALNLDLSRMASEKDTKAKAKAKTDAQQQPESPKAPPKPPRRRKSSTRSPSPRNRGPPLSKSKTACAKKECEKADKETQTPRRSESQMTPRSSRTRPPIVPHIPLPPRRSLTDRMAGDGSQGASARERAVGGEREGRDRGVGDDGSSPRSLVEVSGGRNTRARSADRRPREDEGSSVSPSHAATHRSSRQPDQDILAHARIRRDLRKRQLEEESRRDLTFRPQVNPSEHLLPTHVTLTSPPPPSALPYRPADMPLAGLVRVDDLNVFNRLYSYFLQQREMEAEATQQRQGNGKGDGKGRKWEDVAMASFLLHRQAGERDERLREARDREMKRMADRQKAVLRVQKKSKSYYQLALEKEVMEALRLANPGRADRVLTRETLEFCLIQMKCISLLTPCFDSKSAEKRLRKRQRMLDNLWRMLDLYGLGWVEWVTMVVFFQVLMGAHSPEFEDNRGWQLPPQPRPHPPAAAAAAAAAQPQEGQEGQPQDGGSEPPPPPPPPVPAPIPKIGSYQHIRELMTRFRQNALRREFRELFHHRLSHTKAMAAKAPKAAAAATAANKAGSRPQTARTPPTSPRLLCAARSRPARHMQRQGDLSPPMAVARSFPIPEQQQYHNHHKQPMGQQQVPIQEGGGSGQYGQHDDDDGHHDQYDQHIDDDDDDGSFSLTYSESEDDGQPEGDEDGEEEHETHNHHEQQQEDVAILLHDNRHSLMSQTSRILAERRMHREIDEIRSAEQSPPSSNEESPKSRKSGDPAASGTAPSNSNNQHAKGATMTVADLLEWRKRKTEMRLQASRQQKEADQLKGCSFRPKLTPYHAPGGHTHPHPHIHTEQPIRNSVSRLQRDAAPVVSRHDELYAKAMSQQQRRREMCQLVRTERAQREMEACTFRPQINPLPHDKNRPAAKTAKINRPPLSNNTNAHSTRQKATGQALGQKRVVRDQRRVVSREEEMPPITPMPTPNPASPEHQQRQFHQQQQQQQQQQQVSPPRSPPHSARLRDIPDHENQTSDPDSHETPAPADDDRVPVGGDGGGGVGGVGLDGADVYGVAGGAAMRQLLQPASLGETAAREEPHGVGQQMPDGLDKDTADEHTQKQQPVPPPSSTQETLSPPSSLPSSPSCPPPPAPVSEAEALLLVDVNLAADTPPQRMVIRYGDDPQLLARRFAVEHGLRPEYEAKLLDFLRAQIYQFYQPTMQAGDFYSPQAYPQQPGPAQHSGAGHLATVPEEAPEEQDEEVQQVVEGCADGGEQQLKGMRRCSSA